MTPQDRATRSAEALWAADAASRGLGIAIARVAPGEAVLTMQVRPEHLNGHGICHGGFIFTLADSAFAFACNSYNAVTVAQENQITFLAPAEAGEALTATCTERARAGRSGVYDVTVTGRDDRQIALMRGLSRTLRGRHFPEPDDPTSI